MIKAVLKGLWQFVSFVIVPQKSRNNGKTKYMELKEITEFFEHIRYQIVSSPANGTAVLPTGVGSGFILDYKGESFFVTADHVVNTHDNGIRKIDRNAFIQTNNIGQDENGHYYAELVTMGGIVFCSHLKVDMNTGNVTELPLFDGAFLMMNDFQKKANYITSECNLNGAQVAAGEKKMHLDSNCICVANKDDDYFVFGRVHHKYVKGANAQVFMCSDFISHDGLKYVRDDGNYYVLKYSQPVVVDDWKGLSGSPVLNHNGNLIGIACKVCSVSDEVWVKKIQCMLPLFDAEIMTSRINGVK